MAARYWVGNAAFLGLSNNWNYNTAGVTNWGSASGLIDNVAPPTSADDVTFNGAGLYGNQNSTISAIVSVLSFTVTAGYTNTITHNAVLTVAGNVTLNTSYTIAGTSAMTISATCTFTSNGKTWPNNLNTPNSSITVTLSGNLTVAGIVAFGSTTGGFIFNKTTTETLTVQGGLTSGGATCDLTGTAKVILTGGTISCNSNLASEINVDLDLNGNITIGANGLTYGAGILTYVSGTITWTGTLNLRSSCTLNLNGTTVGAITIGSATVTLTSNFSMSGLMTIANTTTINKTTAETFTTSGGIAVNSTLIGTAEIILIGGTWSGSNTTGITNNLTIRPDNSIVTVSGSVYYRTGTLKYTSSTYGVTTTSSTLNLTGVSNTFDTNGITWNNITLSNTTALTYTINSLLSASGTLTIGTGATTTFAGTAGFSVDTLSCANTAATTINFKESITYTITASFSCSASRVGSIVLFTSSHASTRAKILMPNNGSNTCNVLASFTRIDASGGRTINTFNGTITDCVNVREFHDFQPVAV